MEVLTQPVDPYDFPFSSLKASQRHLPEESAKMNIQSIPATLLTL